MAASVTPKPDLVEDYETGAGKTDAEFQPRCRAGEPDYCPK